MLGSKTLGINRVRFGRSSAELSDKELPKIRFGWFLTMHKFGLSLDPDHVQFFSYYSLKEVPTTKSVTSEQNCARYE